MKTAPPINPDDNINSQKQKIAQLAQTNQLAEARTLASELSLKIPDDPEVWFLLGAIHGGLSEFDAAEKCCKKALAIAPGHPVLNFNMGVALRGQGKNSAAIPYLKTAIQGQADYAEACHELANALYLEQQFRPALEHFEKALKLAPDSAVIHQGMANTLRELGESAAAIHHYEISLSMQPDSTSTYYDFATALIRNYKYTQAITMLESAIPQLPKTADIYYKLGEAYQKQGDSESALEYFNKTLAIDEKHTEANTSIASIIGLQGNYDEACIRLRQLMKEDPDNITALLIYSHFAHHVGETENIIEQLKKELSGKGHTDLTRSSIEFSLGDLLDRSNKPDAAFIHYDAANKLQNMEFDFDGFKGYFESIVKTISTNTITTLPRARYSSSTTPVFIVGMPRSGTTLIEQILASHSQVTGAGELPFISNIVDNLSQSLESDLAYPACLADLNEAVADKLAKTYLDLVADKSAGAALVTDKLPSNFIHLGLINLLFPNAKIIHCLRDPRDTCLSCYFKNFSGAHQYSYNLTDLGKYYRLYQELMHHWGNTLQIPIYEVQYENIVLDQEKETARLLEFCGLDWEDACLNFHETNRTVSTASHDQVRQPVYTKSMNRWKQYEKHIEPMLRSLETDS